MFTFIFLNIKVNSRIWLEERKRRKSWQLRSFIFITVSFQSFRFSNLSSTLLSVARCGYFPPMWLFWKACGGQKPVASSHHDCGYFWPQNRAICGYFWNCLRIGLFVAIFGLEIEMALMWGENRPLFRIKRASYNFFACGSHFRQFHF